MKLRRFFNRRWLGVGGGAVVVALAAGGIAYASSPPAPAPAAGPAGISTRVAPLAAATGTADTGTVARRRAHLIWLIRRSVHADFILQTPTGYRTIEIDRGTLQSDSTGTITIVRPDGPIVKADLTSRTRYPGLPLSQLKTGDRVLLVQSGGDALAVRARGSSGGL